MSETWKLPDWVADFLSRRTVVEKALRDVKRGLRPPLTADECQELANQLSVPSDLRATP